MGKEFPVKRFRDLSKEREPAMDYGMIIFLTSYIILFPAVVSSLFRAEGDISRATKIEEVDEPKTVEELQKELDLLKAENTKTKRNLMWKVRKLEKDKILTENEKIRLERELKSLRGEVERFRSPPLILISL